MSFWDWIIYLAIGGIWSGVLMKIGEWTYKAKCKRRHMWFVRGIQINNPDAKITVFAAEAQDDKALESLKEKLREYVG
jgi:hypothetical protein